MWVKLRPHPDNTWAIHCDLPSMELLLCHEKRSYCTQVGKIESGGDRAAFAEEYTRQKRNTPSSTLNQNISPQGKDGTIQEDRHLPRILPY